MITLKLFINWQNELENRIKLEKKDNKRYCNDKKILRKKYSNYSKKEKEILTLIAQGKVIKSTDNYTIYQIK